MTLKPSRNRQRMNGGEELRLSTTASKLANSVILKYAELAEEKKVQRRETTKKKEEAKKDPLEELTTANAVDEAETLKQIGETWIEEGGFQQAVECYMKALQIDIEYSEERETDPALSLFKLGFAFEQLGKLEQASELAEEALKFREELSCESLEVADCVELLASICFKRGRLQEALPLMDRVKRIRETNLDAGHWDIAKALNLIGMVNDATGHLSSALESFDAALTIFVDYEDDLSTAKTLNNIAAVYRKTGRLQEAAQKYSQCQETFKRILGENCAEVAQVCRNLGGVLSEMKENERASVYWKQSKAIAKSLHGSESLDAAATMSCQADLEFDRGNFRESLALHAEALAVRTRLVGPQHPETAQSNARLGVVYEKLEDYAAADEKLTAALQVMENALGSDNLEVAKVMNSLAAVRYERGYWEPALELFQGCLSVRRGKLGREHLETMSVERSVGDCLCRLGDWKSAVSHFETALWVQQRQLGRKSREAEATLEAVEKALRTRLIQAREQAKLAKATIRNENQREQVLSGWEEVIRGLQSKISEYGAWREPNSVAVAVRARPLDRTNRVLLKPLVGKGRMSWEVGEEEAEEGVSGHLDEVWNSIRGRTAKEREHGKADALVRLDNGETELVLGGQVEQRIKWLLPQGLDEGRRVVIKGLQSKAELNGRAGRLVGMAAGCRDRVLVRLDPSAEETARRDNCARRGQDETPVVDQGGQGKVPLRSEVSVKFTNLEIQLPEGLAEGMRVRLSAGGGAGEAFVDCDGEITGTMEADPSCVSVRLSGGDIQYAKPAALRFLPPPHLKEGAAVMLHGLTGKRNGLNGQVVTVAGGCSPLPRSVLVLLEGGGSAPMSVAVDKVVHPPPRWAQVGRRVLITGGYRRGYKGQVVGADDDDQGRVVVSLSGRRDQISIGVDEPR